MVDQIRLEGRALPIYPARSDDKKPACEHGWKDASTDPTIIKQLWRGRSGLLTGVPTGERSGLAVLDIDTKHKGESWLADFYGYDWPRTRCHATRSGGLHFVFRHRAGLESSESRIAPGVDVRADKGAVIWWPQEGYRVLCEGPVAPWPAVLDEALAEAEERRRQRFYAINGMEAPELGAAADTDTPAPSPSFPEPIPYEINYARRALDNAYTELSVCRDPRRNHLLNALAFKMGRLIVRRWIKREWVEECLWRACKVCGLLDDPEDGPVKTRSTLIRAIEAGMLKPYHNIRWRVMTENDSTAGDGGRVYQCR
jgi:hypothetical protein